MRRIVCLAGAVSAMAVCVVPAQAAPVGPWKGKLDKYTSTLSFSLKGSRVKSFTVPKAPAYCLTGFASISVVVPSAALHGTRISGKHTITYDGETETIALSGTLRGSKAKGQLKLSGPCDGTVSWTAHPA